MGDTSELMQGFGCCRSSYSALEDDGTLVNRTCRAVERVGFKRTTVSGDLNVRRYTFPAGDWAYVGPVSEHVYVRSARFRLDLIIPRTGYFWDIDGCQALS